MTEHGARLADLVRDRGPLPPDEAALLLLPVVSSLASVHAVGGLHGAVSPVAVEIDAAGHAVLLDRTRVAPDPAFTFLDAALGTRPGPAADVWSVAALLLHATTGGTAYPGHSAPREAGWLGPVIELGLRAAPHERTTMAEMSDYLQARFVPPVEPRRRRGGTLAVAGVAAVAALAVLGATLLLTAGQDEPGASGRPDRATSATADAPAEPPTATRSAEPPTPAELEEFARTYVVTASADPERGYAMLTRGYQARSPRYHEVWTAIQDPEILDLDVDPDDLTVRYTYRYTLQDGPRRTEDVSLQLVRRGDRLLIAGATARLL